MLQNTNQTGYRNKHWKNAVETALRPLVSLPRLGLVTDVDGTISPIVDQPDAAQVTPRAKDLLAALAERLALVAAVSGRAAADVRARVGLPGLVYVGNHGLERWASGRVEAMPQAAAYRGALQTALDALRTLSMPGLFVEDKGVTLSVHYRQTARPEQAADLLRPVVAAIAAGAGLKMVEGRMVFELRPPLDIDKGSALRDLVARYALDGAVYLGDDTTDADALRAARALRASGACYALGLGVVSDDAPEAVAASADLLLDGIQDVEDFLAWLLSVRMASSS